MTDNKPTAMEGRQRESDRRLKSPSTARNKDPILEVLRPLLRPGVRVLEIASGTGEHGAHITGAIKGLVWQPSDPSAEARGSIAAWVACQGSANFLPPLEIDATAADWAGLAPQSFDGLVCINMLHISPFEATKGVLRGAGKYLKPGGFVYFYGPFKEGGVHTAPSNAAFDESLRARDPAWGIRDLDEIINQAAQEGLTFQEKWQMPANNLSLLFRK